MRSLHPRDIAAAVAVGLWIILLTSPKAHAVAAWLIGGTPQ
jgi:hypothetical protein